MVIKIGAFGYGLGAIFGAGAVLLAAIGKSEWTTFAGYSMELRDGRFRYFFLKRREVLANCLKDYKDVKKKDE